jgi:hypothetical protein
MISVKIKENIIRLFESEYPISYLILASGFTGMYLVIEEDPCLGSELTVRNAIETAELVQKFFPDFDSKDLPKLL